jgi:cytochrome c oxidase assembly protein subunit 11
MQAQRDAYYAKRNRSLLLYSASVLVLGLGVTYAAVPLYRLFCSATGYAGTPVTAGTSQSGNTGRFSAEKLIPWLGDDSRKERMIKVTFNADCSDALPWKFSPLQKEVRVRPGESALAFYTATNKSPKDIIGIATYNVTPNNVSDSRLKFIDEPAMS